MVTCSGDDRGCEKAVAGTEEVSFRASKVMWQRVAVAINVCSENRPQITECFRRVAVNLQGAMVRIFLDGKYRPEVVQLADSFGFAAILGENLGRNATWNLWWLRMLRFFEECRAPVCFKFDPDTMVDAVPSSLPPDDYFGTVSDRTPWGTPFVQGGVTGLSGTAVSKLLDRKVIESGLQDLVRSLPREFGLADDQLLAEALARVNIHATRWTECLSLWKKSVPNMPIKYAIVHPRYYNEGSNEQSMEAQCTNRLSGASRSHRWTHSAARVDD